MVLHMFQRQLGRERAYAMEAWCGRSVPASIAMASPFGEDAANATCLACLRARRDNALWKSRTEAEIAEQTSAALDRLTRSRARKRAKRRGGAE